MTLTFVTFNDASAPLLDLRRLFKPYKSHPCASAVDFCFREHNYILTYIYGKHLGSGTRVEHLVNDNNGQNNHISIQQVNTGYR